MGEQRPKIHIIGTGRVARSLGSKFKRVGFPISGVWGRDKDAVLTLSNELETQPISDLHRITLDALVMICVSDDAIAEIIDQLPKGIKMAYTSGSVRIKDLPFRKHLGVFYPLQTFSDNRSIDLSEVPFLIEATSESFALELKQLAQELSSTVLLTNSEDRYHIHIAAVMVNNFTNYLFLLAKDHLAKHYLDFDLLKPLIKETINKLDVLDPINAQTGPAVRGDKHIVEKHIHSISNIDTRRIYELLSAQIEKKFRKE